MCKCPRNTGEAKAACYVRVLINVTRIIVIDEVVPEGLAKDNPDKHEKADADAEIDPMPVWFSYRDRVGWSTMHAMVICEERESLGISFVDHDIVF